MKKRFDIELNRIRKIMFKIFLKESTTKILVIFLIGCLLFSIYCYIIANFVDEGFFELARPSLGLFVVSLIGTIIRMCAYVFRVKGNKNDIFSFEYELHDNHIVIKNLTKDTSHILNKKNIKKQYIMYNTLVIVESYVYFFASDLENRKWFSIVE